jgi:AcrR family transcriptional regulator
MGARTVYRHFPDRAELLQALWLRVRDTTDTKFPAQEEDVVPFVRSVFHAFDQHESLVLSMFIATSRISSLVAAVCRRRRAGLLIFPRVAGGCQ